MRLVVCMLQVTSFPNIIRAHDSEKNSFHFAPTFAYVNSSRVQEMTILWPEFLNLLIIKENIFQRSLRGYRPLRNCIVWLSIEDMLFRLQKSIKWSVSTSVSASVTDIVGNANQFFCGTANVAANPIGQCNIEDRNKPRQPTQPKPEPAKPTPEVIKPPVGTQFA